MRSEALNWGEAGLVGLQLPPQPLMCPKTLWAWEPPPRAGHLLLRAHPWERRRRQHAALKPEKKLEGKAALSKHPR